MKVFPPFTILVLLATSCHHNDNIDPSKTGVVIMPGDLVTPPLDQGNFKSLVPLGSLNPSSHTFPTDHMYLYLTDKTLEVPVYAPGDLPLFQISQDMGGVGTLNQVTDYTIEFGSEESYISLGHVARLNDDLAASLDFSKGECQTYTLGNGSVQNKCYLRVTKSFKAGEVIAFCGKSYGQSALDFGMYVNNKPVCPIDFYAEPARTELLNRFSSFDGLVKRTVLPLCGEVDQNLDNTAQGIWLNPGKPKYPESEHIALVHDNIDPALPAFSIGLSVTGLTSNVYYFTSQSSGLVNRDFKDIKPDGQIYCYTVHTKGSPDLQNASIILKMESSKSLKFEKRNCDCSCSPFAFTAPQGFVKE